jgi:hypothetical protein
MKRPHMKEMPERLNEKFRKGILRRRRSSQVNKEYIQAQISEV